MQITHEIDELGEAVQQWVGAVQGLTAVIAQAVEALQALSWYMDTEQICLEVEYIADHVVLYEYLREAFFPHWLAKWIALKMPGGMLEKAIAID